MTADPPDLSLRDQAGHFVKGATGNPSGRGRGVRTHRNRALDALAGASARKVLRALIAKAKDGDVQAARLILDRAWTVPRGRPVEVDMPPLDTARDIVKAMSAIARAVAQGALRADEARDLAGMMESVRKAHELAEIERRLEALEKKTSHAPPAQ